MHIPTSMKNTFCGNYSRHFNDMKKYNHISYVRLNSCVNVHV